MTMIRQNHPFTERCKVCAEAEISSKIYCKRLEEFIDNLVYCPYYKPKSVVRFQAMT
ncbi:hypothetical protein KJN74_05975 [Candidatus Bathyarchaeota archaeon]|nr:hypothetical protein [Candidatus Bathyarchaeota archaeon]